MLNHGPTRLLAPSCFSEISPWAARVLVLLLLALSAYGVGLTSSRDLIADTGRGEDAALYAGIVRDMRGGQGYYAAAEAQLRSRGYPMKSVFNWRLPTLAWIFAFLPSDRAARGVLGGLSMLAIAAWFAALRRSLSSRAAFAGCVVLLGIFAWPFASEAYRVHETWAGIAIALSIAAAALDCPVAAVVAGLSALAIRELALPYVVVAIVLSLRDPRRRWATAWMVGFIVFCLLFRLHTWMVANHQMVTDRAQEMSWLDLGGWWFVLKTAITNFWLISAPAWVAALVLPLSLLGLLGWRTALGVRVSATGFAYVALFLFVGLPFNYLWGLVYAGLAPLGLLRAPAVVRDLLRRSLA
ncbi:MAG: hypothetical protein JXP73_12310 [Deltaproteobacteria bacterium]|nr:hypothetical protein [Deltaproteobacteria bacterium]